MKIKNCYFPLFVSPGVLQKEKDHIEGFAPEVKQFESPFVLLCHSIKNFEEGELPYQKKVWDLFYVLSATAVCRTVGIFLVYCC